MDIQKVKELRQQTGVSVALVTKALKESKNNTEQARELLKKWGADMADKKSGKEAHEGVVMAYVHHNKRMGALVKLQCETDFVAKNEDFQKLAYEIAMQIASMQPKTIDELMKQAYIRDAGKTIETLIKEHITKIGENIKVTELVRFAI